MIYKVNYKRKIDIYEAVSRIKDYYKDFYITKNKERMFLTNLNFIEKILDTQDVYVLNDKEIKGVLLIYKEKGFRPYVKILADNQDSARNLFKFLIWNYLDKELFLKVKKDNPIIKIAQKYGFIFSGDRGQEILLFRKAEKRINKGDKNANNNNESKGFSTR